MRRLETIALSTSIWTILTGEFPPQPGGVSDYTYQLATALAAAGDEVHVWAPPAPQMPGENGGVQVHRLPDHFGKRGRALIQAHLQSHKHARLLVQYVPQAFGYRAMNVGFCRWVRRSARTGIPVDVMFHEVAYPREVGQPLKHRFLAAVNRQMARWMCEAADRVFMSIPAWEKRLRDIGTSKPMRWLPVPSNIPLEADPAAVAQVRTQFEGKHLISHFGTYGGLLENDLRQIVSSLARVDASRTFLLLGRNGKEFAARLLKTFPELAGQIHATGQLDGPTVAAHLAASELVIQPYPDGLNCRRSSAMAAIALGLPVVSSIGKHTEPMWADSGAVALAATPAAADVIATAESALADRHRRSMLGQRAKSYYQERLDLRFTIQALRGGQEQF
jgi:glycosyltransferase involved in cell wall biosynthesis